MKKSLFSFEGRAGRKTWWLTVLAWTVAVVVAQGIALAGAFVSDTLATVSMVLAGLVGLAALVSTLAVSARRWHDLDKSGWWTLIALVPLVGIYALVMNGFVQGTQGDNAFGLDPLAGAALEASPAA